MATLHEIGLVLRSYRKKHGLTVSALAQKSNVHRNTLSALEHGVGNVELNTLLAVCEQLGVELMITPGRVARLVQQGGLEGSRETGHTISQLRDGTSPIQERIAQKLGQFNRTEAPSPSPGARTAGPGSTALERRIAARLARHGVATPKGGK